MREKAPCRLWSAVPWAVVALATPGGEGRLYKGLVALAGGGFRENLEGRLPGRARGDVFRSVRQRCRVWLCHRPLHSPAEWQLDSASIPSVCFWVGAARRTTPTLGGGGSWDEPPPLAPPKPETPLLQSQLTFAACICRQGRGQDAWFLNMRQL